MSTKYFAIKYYIRSEIIMNSFQGRERGREGNLPKKFQQNQTFVPIHTNFQIIIISNNCDCAKIFS